MIEKKKEKNNTDYQKLLNLLIACTDVKDLDDAIKTFAEFYTNKGTTISKKLTQIEGLSKEEKYKKLLKIIETGIGEKGLENVYEKLFDFYIKKNVFPTLNSKGRIIIFDDLLNITDYVKGVYKTFVNLNLYINSKEKSEPINFANILSDFQRLLKVLKRSKIILLDYNSKDDNLYIATLDFIVFFEDLLSLEIDLTQKLLVKSRGGKYGWFQYRKDSKKRNSANMKVGELFNKLEIEEINKISYNIVQDSLKVAKDLEMFLKIFGLESELKKYKRSFVDCVIYFCIYFNSLALLKSNKYDKDIIETISASSILSFSTQTNTDFSKNLQKFAYIKAQLDDLPNNTDFADADLFLVACEVFFIWAFDNQVNTEFLGDKEYEKLLVNLSNVFVNIIGQRI